MPTLLKFSEWLVVMLLAFVIFMAVKTSEENSRNAFISKARSATVSLHLVMPTGREKRFCSGTYIRPGVVLTAAHCVDPMVKQDKQIWVQWHTGEMKPANHIVYGDYQGAELFKGSTNDAALIMVDEPEHIAYFPPLGCSYEPQLGDYIAASGFPYTYGYVFLEGHVMTDQRRLDEYANSRLVTVNLDVGQGMSGGGAYNEAGELVGITSFGLLPLGYSTFAHVSQGCDLLTDEPQPRERKPEVPAYLPWRP